MPAFDVLIITGGFGRNPSSDILQTLATRGYGDVSTFTSAETSNLGNKVNYLTGSCFRLALKEDQGRGWSEYANGINWLWPEPNTKPIIVIDSNNQPRPVVLDEISGQFWELASRDGPARSGITKSYLDKNSSYGGAEIPTQANLIEHKGPHEHNFIEHVESHFYLRPENPENKGASGYNSGGFRTLFEVDVTAYVDGDQSRTAKTIDVPVDGDISYDKKVEGNRILLQMNTTTSEYRMVGTEQYYDIKDSASSVVNRTMTEDDYQEEFNTPYSWFSRGGNLKLNRATAVEAAGSYFTETDGPDGDDESAMVFSSADGLTTPIGDLSGDFSILFWLRDGVYPAEVLSLSDGGLSITIENSGSDYLLKVDDGTDIHEQILGWSDDTEFIAIKVVRTGANLTISANGALLNTFVLSGFETYGGILTIMDGQFGILFDLRIYAEAISDSAFNYYYEDVTLHNGTAILPL